ncbi:hypothetical protein BKK79_08300 [Cupriavidus sp. USMAA2-4]|nr:hypothetical protein BKK79_08300 [Cupriavidus sp. USMAA2-4]
MLAAESEPAPADDAAPASDDEEAADVDELAGALVPPLPPRKSVTYQPEPFSWKPAAVSCFLNVPLAPHEGQSVSGASLIFCSTSRPWPQASQR